MATVWSQDKVDLLKTYLEMGLSRPKIANKMNMSFDSVKHAIDRYNLSQFRPESTTAKKFSENTDLGELNDVDFEKQKEEAKLQWKITKSKIPANKTKPYKTHLVISDVHIPHHDQPSVNSVLRLMDDIKFDGLVINGDFLDYGCISHWTQNKRKTLEMARLKNDYIQGNALLDALDSKLPKGARKEFLYGNHEVWCNDLLESMPSLEGLIEPDVLLHLKERGYNITPYNDFIQLGKLQITHGIYAGTNPVKKHLDSCKVNILFGHTHTIGMMLSSSIAREIAFSAYNIGCLCNLAPDYMRGQPHGWSHGFGIVHVYPNGYFEVVLIRIIDGKFIYNGKIYNGNK